MTVMVDLDRLLPRVMVFAPSCPEPIALEWLRSACREVCETTRRWIESDEVEITDPAAGVPTSIEHAAIFAIEAAELDEYPLEPRDVRWLDRNSPGWDRTTDEGSARYITQLAPDTVAVVPRQTGTLTMRLVLEPSLTAVQVPQFLVDTYGELIGKGAVGRVLTLPKTDYANPSLGAAYLAEFKSKLPGEQRKAFKGQQGAPIRTKPRYF